jgi:flagellar biosynthesis/type III secretory pathway ATPase
MTLSQKARELLSTHREVEDLLAIGAYKHGSVPRLDDALARMPALEAFLRQRSSDATSADDLEQKLAALWTNP